MKQKININEIEHYFLFILVKPGGPSICFCYQIYLEALRRNVLLTNELGVLLPELVILVEQLGVLEAGDLLALDCDHAAQQTLPAHLADTLQ